MINLTSEQKLIILGLIAVIVIGLTVVAFKRYYMNDQKIDVLPEGNGEAQSVVAVKSSIIVQIDGAVRQEGVYRLNDGDRVYDLISLAGGLKKDADIVNVNFAAVLADGQKINIPFMKNSISNTSVAADKTGKDAPGLVVDLNTADEAQLDRLPGIGKSTAQKIIELRNKKGKFFDINELKEIKGFSDKKIKKLSPYLTVN